MIISLVYLFFILLIYFPSEKRPGKKEHLRGLLQFYQKENRKILEGKNKKFEDTGKKREEGKEETVKRVQKEHPC